ncbi:MAG TPA: arsenate reductase [Gammaproteobacteria bacterium]|nr:arsenate reductase [Gammaproteobacteria bacterium]
MADDIILAGITTCDTVRKAQRWLEQHGVVYSFLDLRSDAFVRHTLGEWMDKVDWDELLNKRSTTWRNLTDEERDDLDEARAMSLMMKHPTLIKRPILHFGDTLEIGFSAERYRDLLVP